MATPREEATKVLLKYVEEIVPESGNQEIWKKRLDEMSDRQFSQWIDALESGDEIISLYLPNLSESRMSIERNLKVARMLGHNFFQKLVLTDPETGQTYTTPVEHMVVDLPLRRMAQMLTKKLSIPEYNVPIDDRSDQPSEYTQGAKMSFPELQINAAKGLDHSIVELIKYRGGNEKAYNAMERNILETGSADLTEIDAKVPPSTKSTYTLQTYLKAMHLDNTLLE